MADIVVFGTADTASLAHFYLRHDSPHNVIAFTVTTDYMPPEGEFEGLPVEPFESLPDRYPPTTVKLFAPMTFRKMNRLRQGIYEQIRTHGYELITYVSSRATLFPETRIGSNCFILENNTVQPYAQIGDNTTLWSGNHIGHHTVIRDHVFITSHVVIAGHCDIGNNCVLGIHSTLRDGITLAEGTMVNMDASVRVDTEPWSVYDGVPAVKRAVRSDRMAS